MGRRWIITMAAVVLAITGLAAFLIIKDQRDKDATLQSECRAARELVEEYGEIDFDVFDGGTASDEMATIEENVKDAEAFLRDTDCESVTE